MSKYRNAYGFGRKQDFCNDCVKRKGLLGINKEVASIKKCITIDCFKQKVSVIGNKMCQSCLIKTKTTTPKSCHFKGCYTIGTFVYPPGFRNKSRACDECRKKHQLEGIMVPGEKNGRYRSKRNSTLSLKIK